MLRIKISTEELVFRTRYFCAASTFQNSSFSAKLLPHKRHFFKAATFLEKLIFQKSNIPNHLNFLKSCFFKALTFSKDLTFHSINFSEELLIYNMLFQKRYYCIDTLPFHRFTSSVSERVSSMPVIYTVKAGEFLLHHRHYLIFN